MPYRKTPLVTDEIYHIFNRGIARAPTFTNKRGYSRFTKTISYYRYSNCPKKLSHFLKLSVEQRREIEKGLKEGGEKLVDVICFCSMPNHFHLLVKQQQDDGISEYMRKVIHSYTKYFNTRKDRLGALFQGPFKAVRVETDEQLLHVSRYIHINPYVGNVVTRGQLRSYQYSSLPDYLEPKNAAFVEAHLILNSFRSPKEYEKFVFDEVDYKKSQDFIEHLILE